MAIQRADKFGYGFTLVGVFLSYLLERIFGPRVALLVAVIGVVVGIVFIAAGHLSREPGAVKVERKSLLVGIFVALLAVGTIVFLGVRAYRKQVAESRSSAGPTVMSNSPNGKSEGGSSSQRTNQVTPAPFSSEKPKHKPRPQRAQSPPSQPVPGGVTVQGDNNGNVVGGDNYGDMSVNTYLPPLPIIDLLSTQPQTPKDEMEEEHLKPESMYMLRSRTIASIRIESTFENPAIRVDADHPCRLIYVNTEVGFSEVSGPGFFPGDRTDGKIGCGAAFSVSMLPGGTVLALTFESSGNEELKILGIHATHLR
jgi:hypothetical protein